MTDQFSCERLDLTHTSPMMPFFLSPVPVAESSAPPSLSGAPPSGVLPPLSDTSSAPPPPQPAPPPAAAAAPAAHVQTPPPALSSPDGVSPIALSWMLCVKQMLLECLIRECRIFKFLLYIHDYINWAQG